MTKTWENVKKALSKLRHTVKKKETKSLTNFSICLCSLSLPSHSLPQHHDKNVGERKKALSKLRHTVKKKEQDNDNLDDQLDEMNVCVAERKHINDVNGKILSIPYSSNSDVQWCKCGKERWTAKTVELGMK